MRKKELSEQSARPCQSLPEHGQIPLDCNLKIAKQDDEIALEKKSNKFFDSCPTLFWMSILPNIPGISNSAGPKSHADSLEDAPICPLAIPSELSRTSWSESDREHEKATGYDLR